MSRADTPRRPLQTPRAEGTLELRSDVPDKLDQIAGLLKQLLAKERPQPRRLLRLSEAAAYLHISRGTLRAIVQRGELPIITPNENSPWLLDRMELDHWIERNQRTF